MLFPEGAAFGMFQIYHKDEKLREELDNHLAILKRQGVITGWHHRKIDAGTEGEGAIDEHLNTASVILLLCSAIMRMREKKPKITIHLARQGLQFLLSSPVFTEGTRHLRWLWDYLSAPEKAIIRSVAKNELPALSSAEEVEHLNQLIRLGYLAPTGDGYRILPPIFEKYLVETGLIQ